MMKQRHTEEKIIKAMQQRHDASPMTKINKDIIQTIAAALKIALSLKQIATEPS
jgi:hypothetical protein